MDPYPILISFGGVRIIWFSRPLTKDTDMSTKWQLTFGYIDFLNLLWEHIHSVHKQFRNICSAIIS